MADSPGTGMGDVVATADMMEQYVGYEGELAIYGGECAVYRYS